jgi:demethylmenaquinone methyltransferase/2-methoxy-6-polyprenyl-1,4-benzoquinol methylase
MPRGTLGGAYRLYFTQVLPRIGGLVSGDGGAYAYLPASVARFAAPEDFEAAMTAAGFERVRSRSLTGGIAHLYTGEKKA